MTSLIKIKLWQVTGLNYDFIVVGAPVNLSFLINKYSDELKTFVSNLQGWGNAIKSEEITIKKINKTNDIEYYL